MKASMSVANVLEVKRNAEVALGPLYDVTVTASVALLTFVDWLGLTATALDVASLLARDHFSCQQ